MSNTDEDPTIMRSKYGTSVWKRRETHILVFDEDYWDTHHAQLYQDVVTGKAFSAPPNKNGLKDKIPVSDELDSSGNPKTSKRIKNWMFDDVESYYGGDQVANKDDL